MSFTDPDTETTGDTLAVIPDDKGMVVLNFSLGILAFKAFPFNLVFVGIGYQFTFKVILTAAFKTAFAFFNGLEGGYSLRPLLRKLSFRSSAKDEPSRGVCFS